MSVSDLYFVRDRSLIWRPISQLILVYLSKHLVSSKITRTSLLNAFGLQPNHNFSPYKVKEGEFLHK